MLKDLSLAALLLAGSALAVLANSPSDNACKDMAAARDLMDAAVSVAQKICNENESGEPCSHAAPAAEFAARTSLKITKSCRKALEREASAKKTNGGTIGKPSGGATPYWSYDEPIQPWKPE